MEQKLKSLKVAIVGGDRREMVLMEELSRLGLEVYAIGYDSVDLPSKIKQIATKKALVDIDVIVLPMSGINEKGEIRAIFSTKPLVFEPEDFRLINKEALILVGIISPYLRFYSEKYDLKVIETAELDEVAVFNSIPTAEGAIGIAINELPITLHGSNVLVIGFGRIGITLARMLKGIGAHVAVVARKTKDLARIEEQGYQPISYEKLKDFLQQMDLIFNTVPALVLTDNLLCLLKPETLIIDLASKPGGVDFTAATQRGLVTIHALSLPGKTAPKTAGKILGKAYPTIILDNFNNKRTKGVRK